MQMGALARRATLCTQRLLADPGVELPEDPAELVARLRFQAETRRNEVIVALETLLGDADKQVDAIGDRVLLEATEAVPAVVEALPLRLKIDRIPRAKQVELLYRDLAEQAADRLATGCAPIEATTRST
jgi:hypothetical protein